VKENNVKIRHLMFTAACLGFSLAGGNGFAQSSDVADAIYVGGDIVTIDDARPAAEALAIKGGKIFFVGGRAEADKFKGSATKIIDLGGKTLMPSFIDAHSHYINSLLVANQAKVYAPPSGSGKDVQSIIADIKKFAQGHNIPKGELIMAYGYDDTVMPDGRLLNRDDLDAAFPDNPVRVDHVSMHGAVMNSLALKKYGYSAATVTPPGGVIVRKDGTNEPYGLIKRIPSGNGPV
jgi:predicted amidohydrolase YtcJ